MDSRVKILIVDDQAANLDALEAVLDSADYHLIRAESAQECLLALLKDDIAAIVLDIKMPGISGLELAQIIKQRKRTEHIPILFLTAHMLDERDVLRGYGAGAVDYLGKPINPAILRSKVAVFADLFRKTRALAEANASLQVEIAERHRAQDALRLANEELEVRVLDRTADLSAANDALRDSEERYRQLVQALPTAVYTCDRKGRIRLYNAAAVSLWGREPEIGKDLWCGSWKLYNPDGTPLPLEHSPMAVTVREGRPVRGVELVVEKPDGARRNIVPYPEPIFDAQGRMTGAVNMLVDITDHKRIEEERIRLLESERQARGEAEKANRLKDEFLATVSHELRNPLHAVLGWTGLLRKSVGDNERLGEGLEVIERNAKLQAQLISDLLDVSRITSGKLRLNVEPVELGTVIRDAVDTIHQTAVAKGVRIEQSVRLNGRRVPADPRRIQQILWNLLSNAVKFTPSGGRIEVLAELEESAAVITVRDSGQGIHPDFLPHLFERFRQADASASRRHGGLGIGLAIVKHLAELHGGWVEVDSSGEGAGATFRVRLPLDPRPDAPSENGHEPGVSAEPEGPIEPSVIAGLRILVVDDDPDGREFLRRILEESGAEVLAVDSAQEAYQAIIDHEPDLLLSDIGMPGEDGYQFIRRVRDSGHSVPAIAVTAFVRSSDRTHAVEAGYQGHITKPVEPSHLLATIVRVLGEQHERGGPHAPAGESLILNSPPS